MSILTQERIREALAKLRADVEPVTSYHVHMAPTQRPPTVVVGERVEHQVHGVGHVTHVGTHHGWDGPELWRHLIVRWERTGLTGTVRLGDVVTESSPQRQLASLGGEL